MADEFLTFLVAGLIIIAILLVIFAGGIFVEGIDGPREFTTRKNLTAAAIIGPQDVNVTKVFTANFDASYTKQTTTQSAGTSEIRNGVLFGSSTLKYTVNAAEIEAMAIKFDVTRTNSISELVIVINNQTFLEQKLFRGHYEYIVPREFLSEKMDIIISARSSTWRLWAPNLYNLENIDFVIKAFSLEQEETNFFLEDWEYDNFRTGKVELNLEENIGRMVLIVNGDTAFSDSVGDLDTVSIQKSYFKKGTNSVIFSGRENSKFAGRARIRITYVDTRENSARLDFNLTQSQYNNFPRGRIVFDVIDVQKSGGLQVRVSNGNEVLLNEFQSVGEGKITVWINKRDVLPGINKIEIKSVDGAVFAIENFKIEF